MRGPVADALARSSRGDREERRVRKHGCHHVFLPGPECVQAEDLLERSFGSRYHAGESDESLSETAVFTGCA